MDLEVGTVIEARTYAEFLNKTFGCNYKGWMKGTFEIDHKTTVWMIHIDSIERGGYHNYMDGDCIVEVSDINPTRSHKPIRMVFQIIEGTSNSPERVFMYKGKFTMDLAKTNATHRYFKPIKE